VEMKLQWVLSAGVVCALAPLARGQYIGAGFPIIDAQDHLSEIDVSDPSIVTQVQVTILGLSHPCAGDVGILLDHTDPHGNARDIWLFERPGVTDWNQKQGRLSFDGDYAFFDSAGSTLGDAVNGGGSTVPPGTYHPAQWDGSPSGSLTFLPDFDGETAAGTWTVGASDWVSGDEGAQADGGSTSASCPSPPRWPHSGWAPLPSSEEGASLRAPGELSRF